MPFLNYLPRIIAPLLLIVMLASCRKELSLETGVGPSTSTFTLVASGSDCSDALATGDYVVGTALSAANLVMVTVDVTQVGSWSYNTGTVKGFSFSGSGSFAATGQQIIVLKGSGKPTEGGSIVFPLNIGGTTCSFSVTVTDGAVVTGDIYYKATIGGVDYYQAVTATNHYEAGSGLGGTDDVAIGAGISYETDPLPKGLTSFGIEKGLMHGYLASTNAQFKAFFAVATYPYAPPGINDYQNGDGIIIAWTDKDGNNWSSHTASTAQPAGSNFKILSVEDATDITGTYYVKVKMQFNCILYKENTNLSMQLTNGEMVGYFGKI
jgi:hypothetical protein